MEAIANRSLRISRVFDAPADLVWKVWTTPELIKDWWGPDGFTNSIDIMEVKVGGCWKFTMHGPDGTDYQNAFIYKTLIPYRKIVMDHITEPKFTLTAQFSEKDEKTSMEWQLVFEKAPDLDEAIRVFKADEGLTQTVERLGVFLGQQK